ncbi:MAG TPA: DUF732 domain-containing protein [Mycobacterium sp.]
MGIWLAPTAHADPQDQALLSFLAANNVAVDPTTAINAAHVACAQITNGQTPVVVNSVVAREFPTLNGNEYWISAAARKAYCP